ncbi:hypothetical protein Hypma_012414 [Hypsizygus marmoreus]|uniref:Uncharacterized protein n=1 Tax=Hypsizygus marmoreus TaxID=39966 RepID=A0A369JGX0_HYPMA|nr:hypothetical protein Hypma_012414 [Hypsizygus marmoreus]
MPIKPFTRRQLLGATTTRPWTTDFRHLLPIPKKWLKRSTVRDPLIKSVRPKERIKYWNVVPGDQIRLLGDKKNTLHEVLSINRISNRVFVKGAVNTGEEDSGKIPPSKNYHYSRCQLFLGNYELPPTKSKPEPQVVPVFAQRLGSSSPLWNSFFRRYDWTRFATRTVPVIPHLKGDRIPIPWPTPAPPSYPEPTSYDTPKDVVMEVTYKPPAFTPSMKGLIPRPPSEPAFLRALYNPHQPKKFDESAPVESYLFRELANPHSRAKKLARWKMWQFQKKARLEHLFAEATNNLRGRNPREARAEAAWQWRQEMKEQEEALRKQRWKRRNPEAMLERQARRTARKEAKQRQRLTAMVLKDEPNQVIPKDMLD